MRRHIVDVRDGLVAEHLGVPVQGFQQAVADHGSFLQAVEALRGSGRSLRKFTKFMIKADVSPLAENDLMDPDHVPPSVAQSVWSVVTTVATWPLTEAAPRLLSFLPTGLLTDSDADPH